MKILLEMRPALDGHAGIPQETRLLFRGLRQIEGMHVEGLLQSSGNVLAKGLPPDTEASAAMPAHKQLNRLSRVVISIKKALGNAYIAAIWMAMRQLAGGREQLARFDATHFKDFIWRSLFARTLHADDFNLVTSARFRIARVPWTAMHRCALITRKLGYALYPRLETADFDVMIAETPYPGTVSSRTKLIVRYHDAIPVLMPHTISDKAYHQASHYHALRKNVASGAWFACVSEATRKDLLSIFPEAADRSVTIHNMVSHHYHPEDSSPARVPEIIRTRLNARIKIGNGEISRGKKKSDNGSQERGAQEQNEEYLLIVSTIEPRKNHVTLLAAWENMRAEKYPHLKLVIVGMLGWDHKPIVKKFLPWMERGQLFVLEDVPSPELRVLYKHARATVCPSFGEGFDFSGVEAMRCGGAVVASRIPVHEEVYANAAEYFSPYSTAELVAALEAVISQANFARRVELVARGATVSAQYLPEKILPQWHKFLQSKRASQNPAMQQVEK